MRPKIAKKHLKVGQAVEASSHSSVTQHTCALRMSDRSIWRIFHLYPPPSFIENHGSSRIEEKLLSIAVYVCINNARNLGILLYSDNE